MSPSVNILIAAAVLLVCALADWLHARRAARIARLAYRPAGRPRACVTVILFARAIGAAVACWRLRTLLAIEDTPVDLQKAKVPDRHLILALDVSPSMYSQDAGPDGKKTRQHRAAEVMQSILNRLDMAHTR